MLTPNELQDIRAEANQILVETAEIRRRQTVPDGAGGFTVSWQPVGTVKCRLAPVGDSAQERAIADKLTAKVILTVLLPAETDIRHTDRLVVGSRILEVVGVFAKTEEIVRKVIAAEVT